MYYLFTPCLLEYSCPIYLCGFVDGNVLAYDSFDYIIPNGTIVD
jgi:hypothetical protein